MPGPAVRKATADDREEIFGLAAEFATTFTVRPDAFDRSLRGLLDRADACLLVADQEGNETVGYLLGFEHPTFFGNGSVGWIEELFVRSGRRRHGLGSLLVRHFEDWAKTRGTTMIALATRRAGSFYRSSGYEESARYLRKIL